MNPNEFAYTIGIRPRYLPFFKKYRVLKHSNEAIGSTIRLNLHCADGALIGIPDIAKQTIKLYPDYNESMQKQRALVKPLKEPEIDATTLGQ